MKLDLKNSFYQGAYVFSLLCFCGKQQASRDERRPERSEGRVRRRGEPAPSERAAPAAQPSLRSGTLADSGAEASLTYLIILKTSLIRNPT
ncbi:MAG: hypothetical protein IJ424_00445 [Oscillospiraceae bacterium]|nr:hypothetical protein [Oscillospiraceae bacterium]